jgi:hypothetical protein
MEASTMFKRHEQERCEVIGCTEPGTYYQLVECDATRTTAAETTIKGRATISSVCEAHSKTERASQSSIDNTRQLLAARGIVNARRASP